MCQDQHPLSEIRQLYGVKKSQECTWNAQFIEKNASKDTFLSVYNYQESKEKTIGYQRIPDYCRERHEIQDEKLMPTHPKLAEKDVGAF